MPGNDRALRLATGIFRLSRYRHRSGVLFAVATALFLGAITTQAKFVYQYGGNALTLMTVRFAATAIVIGLILLLLRCFAKSRVRADALQGDFWLTLITGVTWSVAMICYLMSVQYISVSIAALVLFTFPLMILLVSVLRQTIAFTWTLLALFSLAFVGLGFAMLSGQLVSNPMGIALALTAAVGAAITFFLGAKISQQVDPLTLVFQVSVIGLVLVLPLVWHQFRIPDAPGYLPLAGATGCYIFAIVCQFSALGRLAPALVAFILNLEPVMSILAASIWLNESPGVLQWLGMAMVFTALMLSSKMLPGETAN